MQLRHLVDTVIALIPLSQERRPPDADTARFLTERNAQLIIQERESASYFAVRAYPEMDVYVKQQPLHVSVKLLPKQKLHLSISTQVTMETVSEITTLFSDSARTIQLDLDGSTVKLELSAAPNVN